MCVKHFYMNLDLFSKDNVGVRTEFLFTTLSFILFGLSHVRRHELHLLDVVDRIKYRLCVSVSVYKCPHSMAPQYLSELCTPVA